MLVKEALVVLANSSRLMSEKMEEPVLNMHGWVTGRIAIVVTRSYSLTIHGAHLPSTLRERDPDLESGSGLGLVQINCAPE